MIRKTWIILPFVALLWAILPSFKQKTAFKPHEKLSDYALFSGEMKMQKPAKDVIPYDLNTPLFSDYAFKLRFVKIPEGKQAIYSDKEVFEFPEGTILAKTFYYPEDFRKPEGKRRIMETRLLYKQTEGWSTFPYIWNDEQTEAYYDVAGRVKTVEWTHHNGKKRSINYVIPNKNQCKQCHEYKGEPIPIGPTARSLNKAYPYPEGNENQLVYWQKKGILKGAPEKQETNSIVWNKPESGTLNERARAYLDVNCGHCHRAEGQASTSGLFLNYLETDSTKLGIYKTPVAAGRAAADMQYSIHPGKPEKSILIYRLHSLDPGIMMPEMGRRTVDEEGLLLLTEWIKAM